MAKIMMKNWSGVRMRVVLVRWIFRIVNGILGGVRAVSRCGGMWDEVPGFCDRVDGDGSDWLIAPCM